MAALTLTFDDLRRDKRVQGFPFQVAEYLHRYTKRCYDESFTATQTIANHFQVHVRTIQRAFRCLALAGYLLVIRDRSKNSGHRLRMFWRNATVFPCMRPETPTPSFAPDASVNDHAVAAAATELSPNEGVPPDPPIKVSEDGSMGKRTDDTGAGDPGYAHPAPEEAESSSSPALRSLPPEEEEPKPEEVANEAIAELVQAAAPVLGVGPAAEGRVRSWARQWCPDWVRAALGITAAAGDRVKNPARYTLGVLKTFDVEGGPLAAPVRSATPEEEDAAWAFILGPRTASPGAGP